MIFSRPPLKSFLLDLSLISTVQELNPCWELEKGSIPSLLSVDLAPSESAKRYFVDIVSIPKCSVVYDSEALGYRRDEMLLDMAEKRSRLR